MLEGAGGHAEIDGLLNVSLQETVNQTGRERVSRSQAIDDFDLVRPGSVDRAVLVGDRGPDVLPDQGVFPQRDRHDFEGKALGNLSGHVLEVLAFNTEDTFDVLL